jgi:hypothetical protein
VVLIDSAPTRRGCSLVRSSVAFATDRDAQSVWHAEHLGEKYGVRRGDAARRASAREGVARTSAYYWHIVGGLRPPLGGDLNVNIRR